MAATWQSFPTPHRGLVKRQAMMARERVLIPPDPEGPLEQGCREMTLHLDPLPTEYPALADWGSDALFQEGRRALASEAARRDRARDCFRAVAERYPAYWPAVNNLGVATESRGAGHHAAAAAYYLEVIRGSLAMLAGELRRAAAPTVVPVAGEHLMLSLAAAYLNLSSLLRGRGRAELTPAFQESAAAALRRSLAVLDPGQARQQRARYLVMAACFHEFGRRQEAYQALQKAYELGGDDRQRRQANNGRPLPPWGASIASNGRE